MLHKFNSKARRKGQSTVEYIVLVTAVLAVVILFMTSSTTGFQYKLNATMGTTTEMMGMMAGRMANGIAPIVP